MENALDKINELLQNKKWTGYIWYVSDVNNISDVNSKNPLSKPKIFIKEVVDNIEIIDFNYIQEMYLFDGENIAIHSKYLGDDNQRFFVNRLRDFKNKKEFEKGEEKNYPSHLQKFGIEKTIFQTIYKNTPTIDGSVYTWEPVLEFFKGLKLKEDATD